MKPNNKELAEGTTHERGEHMDLYKEVQEAIEEGEEMDEDEFFEMIAAAHIKEHPGYYKTLKKVFPETRSKGY